MSFFFFFFCWGVLNAYGTSQQRDESYWKLKENVKIQNSHHNNRCLCPLDPIMSCSPVAFERCQALQTEGCRTQWSFVKSRFPHKCFHLMHLKIYFPANPSAPLNFLHLFAEQQQACDKVNSSFSFLWRTWLHGTHLHGTKVVTH